MSVCVCTVSIIHIDTNLGSSVREGAHRASLSAESVTQCQWIPVDLSELSTVMTGLRSVTV